MVRNGPNWITMTAVVVMVLDILSNCLCDDDDLCLIQTESICLALRERYAVLPRDGDSPSIHLSVRQPVIHPHHCVVPMMQNRNTICIWWSTLLYSGVLCCQPATASLNYCGGAAAANAKLIATNSRDIIKRSITTARNCFGDRSWISAQFIDQL